jgi:Tol biopolymer transport system component
LYAAPMSLSRLELTGPALPVEGPLAAAYSSDGGGRFDAAADTLVYEPPRNVVHTILTGERAGGLHPLALPGLIVQNVIALSPDGSKLALTAEEDSRRILYTYDLQRGVLSRLTADPAMKLDDGVIFWTPDSKRITFDASLKGEPVAVFWQLADGGTPAERLTVAAPGTWHSVQGWSADGRTLFYRMRLRRGGLWGLTLGDKHPRPLSMEAVNPQLPAISPDGRWIAYADVENTADPNVYLRPFPGLNEKWRISPDGGVLPQWTRGGHELTYISFPGFRWMAVSVETTPTLRLGPPIEIRRLQKDGWATISSDGQHIAISETDGQPRGPQISVVLHWFAELRRLMASGGG